MRNDKSKDEFRVPYASRFDMVLYAALGILNIAIVAIIARFVPEIDPVFTAVLIAMVYLGEIAYIAKRRLRASKAAPERNIHGLLSEDGSIVFKNSKSPIVAFDLHGSVLWYNDAMREALDSYDNYIGRNVSEVLNV